MNQLEIPNLDDDTAQSESVGGDALVLSSPYAPAVPLDAGRHAAKAAPEVYTFRGGYRGRTALYRHQAVGISRLSNSDVLLLGDEQGLGKTIQALYAQCVRMKRREAYGAVIVCFQRHVSLWLENIEEHEPRILPMLQVVSGLPPDKRIYDLSKRFWIINYEVLGLSPRRGSRHRLLYGPAAHPIRGFRASADAGRLLDLLDTRPCILLCDEIHALRTPTSRRSRVLTNIGAHAKFRYGLTGTPIAERSWDLWSQMFFLDHGATLGKSYAAYLARFAVMRDTRYGAMPIRGKNLEELNERIRPVVLRRMKADCLDLPKKTVRYVPVLFEGKDRAAIQNVQDALLKALGEAVAAGHKINLTAAGVSSSSPLAKQISGLMARLSVMTALPRLIDPTLSLGVKYEMLCDVMEQRTCPVIVWCINRKVSAGYAEALRNDGYCVGMISGDVKVDARTTIVKDFKAGNLDALVCTGATMQDGVTLVKSHYAVYVQRNYERVIWKQSQDRIDRIGQTVPVTLDVFVSDLGLDLHNGCVLSSKDDEACTVLERANRALYSQPTLVSLRNVLLRGEADHRKIIGEW